MNATFTAAQIAQALGCSRQAAQGRLAAVQPSGVVIVQGNEADAWAYADLPDNLRAELLARARLGGYRDALHLLQDPGAHWQPPVPLDQCSKEVVAVATKRRTAFLPFLPVKDGSQRNPGVGAADGIREYGRVFGHPITRQGWWKDFDRFIARDRNHFQWERLEIYLDERPGKSGPRQPVKRLAFDHSDLGDAVTGLSANLTPAQKRLYVIDTACQHCEALMAEHPARRDAVLPAVALFLRSAMGDAIAKNDRAMKKTLARKYAQWIAGGKKPDAIQDRRAEKSGWKRAPAIPAQALDGITANAVFRHGSRVAPAWREFMRGEIPGVKPDPALAEYYAINAADKSDVPRHVRKPVQRDAAAMKLLHHGRYQYGQSAHLKLDDSGIFAGDWWSSDDFTLPVYFWIPGDNGPILMRGQFLLTVDQRSRCILGFCLIPRKSYDSLNILSHFLSVCREHGLVRRGVIWERGLWQKSKLVKGSADADSMPPEEAELGLRRFGVEFIHRRSPKAKIVERIGGLLQDRMEGEPGYCGRNEMVERFEECVRLKADVEAGRVDPAGVLYSFDQWVEHLEEICADYNRTPYGRDTNLAGLSPNDFYELMQNAIDPPIRFDASLHYSVFNHVRVVRVTANGIDFTCGKRHFLYRNATTGALIGQRVKIYFDPESPDVAGVTDLQGQNPFSVELCNPVPTVGASGEQLADEMRKLRGHQAPILARYRTLKANFKQLFRQNLGSPESVETGRLLTEGAEQIRSHRTAANRTASRALRAGIALPETPRDPESANRGLDMMQGGLARMAAREATENHQDTP